MSDSWKWKAELEGHYTDKSTYAIINKKDKEETSGCYSIIWKLKVIRKATILFGD